MFPMVPGTIEYRLFMLLITVAIIAIVLFVTKKLPMKWAENFYKFSNYLFGAWLFIGGAIDWVITGNVVFIMSYLYPYIAIPMLTGNLIYGYMNWRELRQWKAANAG